VNEFFENLKRQAAENPIVALGVAAGLVTAVAKFMEANTESRNAKVWAREVNRRAAKDARK